MPSRSPSGLGEMHLTPPSTRPTISVRLSSTVYNNISPQDVPKTSASFSIRYSMQVMKSPGSKSMKWFDVELNSPASCHNNLVRGKIYSLLLNNLTPKIEEGRERSVSSPMPGFRGFKSFYLVGASFSHDLSISLHYFDPFDPMAMIMNDFKVECMRDGGFYIHPRKFLNGLEPFHYDGQRFYLVEASFSHDLSISLHYFDPFDPMAMTVNDFKVECMRDSGFCIDPRKFLNVLESFDYDGQRFYLVGASFSLDLSISLHYFDPFDPMASENS
nr:hypothetical protein Iba_chr03bCG9510 [Ipomoea batatas]